MSAPARQRSLRERLHGIGISWQGKRSKSYHSKEGKTFTDVEAANIVEDSPSCDPIPSTDETPQDEAGGATAERALEKKPLCRTITQPHGTEQYKVAASDTLAGIAARFDTTPSELAKLNRLSARIVFPGQLLFVPEKRSKGAEGADQNEEKAPQEAAVPPHHLAYLNDDRRFSVPEALRIPYRRPSERSHRFLKVKARHFTDGQGVVSGVLIITPNAVMFDPNVSDPLVMEHGTESYGVIAPLDMVMRTAIYFDIAHMKVQHAPPPLQSQPQAPKSDVYYGKMPPPESSTPEEQKTPPPSVEEKLPPVPGSLPQKEDADVNQVENTDSMQVKESKQEQEMKEAEQEPAQEAEPKPVQEAEPKPVQEAEPKSVQEAEPKPVQEVEPKPVQEAEPKPVQAPESKEVEMDTEKRLEEAEANEDPTELSEAPERVDSVESDEGSHVETRRERMLKRLSYPMESITSFSRILSSSPKSLVDFSGALFSKGSEDEEKAGDKEEEPKGEGPAPEVAASVVGYKNFVEEKPEIFEALDKLLTERGAAAKREHEGPPLYLCLRMGIPKERKSHTTPVLSYGKKRARSEYWFSIPHNRVEDLYCFLQQWIPQLYGDVDDVDPEASGFQIIDDTEEDDEEDVEALEIKEGEDDEGEEKKAPRSFLKLVEDHFGFRSISPSDWEVLSLSEMDKVPFSELELPLPELLAPSVMLNDDHIKELYTLLPARAVGYPWTQIFSTETDGFSLKTLYRKMAEYDTPVVLAVQDTEGAVFGALLSSPLQLSDHFYGTGESFLYTFHPEFKVFKWTQENMYFVKGNNDSVAIGAGEGVFGLWLDGDLYRGASNRCQTFDNDPLASAEDFVIKALEAWGFV